MRVSPPWLLALALALGCRRSPGAVPRRAPPRENTTVALATPPPVHVHRAGWVQGFRVPGVPRAEGPGWDVAVTAPPDFDATQPLHLVILAHGMGHHALQWLARSPATLAPGQPPVSGWGSSMRHDFAHTRTLLIAPQFYTQGPRHWGRWFARPAALREFLDTLLGDVLVDRLGSRRSSADVASITLVGSSAGGYFIDAVLAHSDLAPRVQNVVFFDALYMGPTHLVPWLTGSPDGVIRRLVSIDGGGATITGARRALRAALPPRFQREVAVDPEMPLSEAIRTRRVVFVHSAQEHIAMGIHNLTKVLQGLDLPRRTVCAQEGDPKAMRPGQRAVARAVEVGQRVREALTADDARLQDGSAADDWAIDLPAGRAVTVRVRGDRELRTGWAELDVVLRVLHRGEVIAENDDEGRRGRAGLVLVPAEAGAYVLRVTTHGPWLRTGGYVLTVQ